MNKVMVMPKKMLLLRGVFLLAIVALSITGYQAVQSSEHSKAEAKPKVIAVKFHADWCGYCKAMGPVFKEMQAKYDQEPVLYVTFDQTREYNRVQSQYMANAMKLDHVWQKHGGSTGFILLINAETKDIMNKLNHDQNLKEMGAALLEAVKQVS